MQNMETNDMVDALETGSERAKREIAHGALLAESGAEDMWGWGSVAGQQRAVRRGELIANAAGLRSGIQALELGCGTGLFTELFAKSEAYITAVDISEELLAQAEKRNLPKNRVKFVCERFEEFDSAGVFDAVVGSSVLHHLDIEPTLTNIYRLLKPGGRMVFAEPNMLNPQIIAERTFLRNRLKQVSEDETAFVRWKLRRQLLAHGFDGIKITPFDWLHPKTPVLIIKMVNSASLFLEKTPIIREFSGSLLIQCMKPI